MPVKRSASRGAGRVVDALEPHLPFEFIKVHHEPDGHFPNGVPNPLLIENRAATADRVVAEQAVRASVASDHTVRVFVQGLSPDTVYYYRFHAGSDSSPYPGRTRTAPLPGASRKVRFAAISCQSYEQGYYGALRRMTNDDIAAEPDEQIDFVLHLGDFIYERTGDVHESMSPVRLIGPLPDGTEPWEPDGTHPEWQKGAVADQATTLAP